LSENIYVMHEEIFYQFHTAHTTTPNNELTSRHNGCKCMWVNLLLTSRHNGCKCMWVNLLLTSRHNGCKCMWVNPY
jgi:hypothetical protein